MSGIEQTTSSKQWHLPQDREGLLAYLDYQNWATSPAEDDLETVWQAYLLAREAHNGQKRESGEPFILHLLSVAKILVKYHLDEEAVAAALLHDVVEDTSVSLDVIEQRFGSKIAALVDGVSKLKLRQYSRQKQDAENLRKLFLAMVSDVRVVLIKLADRLHNVRTLSALPEHRRKKKARETLDIFSPLAERLGIWEIRAELEDLSFRSLKPEAYVQIAAEVQRIQEEHQEILTGIIERVRARLLEAHLPANEFTMTGRPKHIYSIYKKMNTPKYEGKGVEQIYDKLGVRIIVNTIPECYTVLGIVHSEWPPLPGEFDDYIGMRLPSGYQSLHTAARYSSRKHDVVEFQIRTHEMHYDAEYGIAAHWLYKEQGKRDIAHERKVAWLRQMIEGLQQSDEVEADAETFIADFKTEVLQDRVYVFTPKGDIIDLPNGSTPIDFAYRIHTEVGQRCRGAKINGKIVPLNYHLKNGEQVEILAAKRGGPSRDWLNVHLGYLKTSRARAKVRQWFRRQNYEECVSQGRVILDRELHRLGISEINYEKLAREFSFNKVDDFLAAMGRSDINTHQVVRVIKAVIESDRPGKPDEVELPPLRPSSITTSPAGVQIQGVGNLLTNLAQCCRPVPGDNAIIGYITRGRGVTIHRQDCPNMLRFYEQARERLIAVDWDMHGNNDTYPVDVQIEAFDRPGLLRDITAVVANEKINMSAVNVITKKKENKAKVLTTLEIANIDQLSRVLALIAQLPNVVEVRRRRGS